METQCHNSIHDMLQMMLMMMMNKEDVICSMTRRVKCGGEIVHTWKVILKGEQLKEKELWLCLSRGSGGLCTFKLNLKVVNPIMVEIETT